MNFFVDFEATQFSNGIIAVGCVSEEDDKFYTLVNTKHKVTPFITNLTGITAAEVEMAPEPEVVFKALLDWVRAVSPNEEKNKPHFYCYGNCDKEFVKKFLSDYLDYTIIANDSNYVIKKDSNKSFQLVVKYVNQPSNNSFVNNVALVFKCI